MGRCVDARAFSLLFLGWTLCLVFACGDGPLLAQGPGTLPPTGLFQTPQPWPGQLEGIRPEAFLFQDESNTPVVMPRMSFEEIDRLQKLDRGTRSGDRVATLERLSIDTTIAATRGEIKASLAVRLDGVAVRELVGRSVVIDIGMAGMHLLDAVDVRFATKEQQTRESKTEPTSQSGEIVAGAYVRLQSFTAARLLGSNRAASGGDTGGVMETGRAVDMSRIGEIGRAGNLRELADASGVIAPGGMGGGSIDATFLPAAFPAALRQAIGAEASEFYRRDRGYQLVLPVESLLDQLTSPRRSVLLIVGLKLSARVWSVPPRQSWLPMSLPAVSTSIDVTLQDAAAAKRINAVNVVGSGQEVVRRIEDSNRFAIECDGGMIALRLSGTADAANETGELIEVESETQLQWESPTEPPTMDTRLLAKNLRGPLRQCTLVLPASTVLVSPPEIISTGSDARGGEALNLDDSGATTGNHDASWWEVSVSRPGASDSNSLPLQQDASSPAVAKPGDAATRVQIRWMGTDQMQPPRSVRLRLQLRQFPAEATAAEPWVLQIPQVNDAIGHRGRVTIRTAGEHRLRWRPRLGIDAIVSEQTADKNGDAVYPFRFSQTRFELPVWLSGKQQQVRVAADVELEVTRRAARVRIDVGAGGGGIDPKGLRLDLGDWRLLGIKADNRSAELEISTTDNLVEWQVDTSDGNWPTKYQITAELLASATTDDFKSLSLPRLVSSDPATVLSNVRLTLLDGRRESWLVDLTDSPALQRVSGQSESQFRFLTPETAWSVRGNFASRTLQLQWSADVAITQSSDQWVIRSKWTITSPLDLEGRLRFSRPAIASEQRESNFAPAQNVAPEKSGVPPADPALPTEQLAVASNDPANVDAAVSQRWKAIVDGQPAIVRRASRDAGATTGFATNDTFEIISPNLDIGAHQIELVCTQGIVAQAEQGESQSRSDDEVQQGEIAGLLALPTPVADQVELKSRLTVQMPVGVVDAKGVFWRVLPNMDGVLGNFRDAAQFEFDSAGSAADESPADVRQSNTWKLGMLPDFPIPIVIRSRFGEEKLTEIPRSLLRSLVGREFRHEHLMATVRGGRRVRLGLPAGLQTIRVEALLDGQPVASIRDASGLRIDLPTEPPFTTLESSASTARAPDASGRIAGSASSSVPTTHLLDVRIWTEEPNNPWWSRCTPLLRLPVGSGLQYWQLVVPTDSHLYWASSQSGRAMRWERDQLKMSRVPALSDPSLIRWALDSDWQFGENNASDDVRESVGAAAERAQMMQTVIRQSLANSTFSVPGNRYLFFAGNTFSFDAITVSRTVLWLVVGGLVLLLASAFQWFPLLHHPIVAFVLAIAMVGLLVIAPDGIVLTAQLVMISLTLVAVFYAISAVSAPRGGRVLQSRSTGRDSVVSRVGGGTMGGGAMDGASAGGGSQRASGKTPRRDSATALSETCDFEPRYVPTAADGSAERLKAESARVENSHAETSDDDIEVAGPTDESASRSGVFDVSDPDSSEAPR